MWCAYGRGRTDNYRAAPEQIVTEFHSTETNNKAKEQQAGFITKTYQVNLISFCRQVTGFIKKKIAIMFYLQLDKRSIKP